MMQPPIPAPAQPITTAPQLPAAPLMHTEAMLPNLPPQYAPVASITTIRPPYVRPGEVKSAAILGIIWGILAILGSALFFGVLLSDDRSVGTITYGVFNVLLAIAVIVFSVLLLQARTVGRATLYISLAGGLLLLLGLLATIGLFLYIPPLIFFALALQETRNYQ